MFIRTFPSQNQLFCNLFGKFNPPQKLMNSHQNISFAKFNPFLRKFQPSSETSKLSSEHFRPIFQLLQNAFSFIPIHPNPSQSLSQSIPPSFHFDRKIKLEMTQIPTFAQKISFGKFEEGHFSLQSISKECVYFLFEMRNGLEMECEMKSKFETKCI